MLLDRSQPLETLQEPELAEADQAKDDLQAQDDALLAHPLEFASFWHGMQLVPTWAERRGLQMSQAKVIGLYSFPTLQVTASQERATAFHK
jgi:hypothetical protein